MTVDWAVDLEIDDYSWHIERGDEPDPNAVNVRDGLSIGWMMPDAALWPVQPEPVAISLQLVAPSADMVDLIDRGSPVKLLVYAGVVDSIGNPVPSIRFVGKVSDLDATAIRYAHHDAGIQVNITATDVLADLASANVRGTFPFQGVGVHGWVAGMFNLAGIPAPDWDLGGDGTEIAASVDGEVPGDTLSAAVETLLSAHADGGPIVGDELNPADHLLYHEFGWRRGVVIPNLDAAGDLNAATPYRIEWVSQRNTMAAYSSPSNPGRLMLPNPAPPGALWDVFLTPPPDTINDPNAGPTEVTDLSLLLRGDYVDMGTRWIRTRRTGVNRVIITCDTDVTAAATPGEKWRKVTRSNDLQPGEKRAVGQINDVRIPEQKRATDVADMYLGDPDAVGMIWQAESLRWYASRDPQWPIVRSLFPDNWNNSTWFGGFSAPIVVEGIAGSLRPGGRRWYAGILGGATWTFDAGEFTVDLKLFPRVPMPGNGTTGTGGVGPTYDEMKLYTGIANQPGTWLKWNQLSPDLDWVDLRLARSYYSDLAV